MPYINFTEKLLGLQDLTITNIKECDKLIKIFAKLEVKEQHWGCLTSESEAALKLCAFANKTAPKFLN